jgi:hypothetical protein
MTLSNQTSKNVYVGDDSTLIFAYTFRIFADADLEVTIQDTSVDPQTEITLVLNTDYTVSGADNPTGGNVTLVLGGQLSVAPTTTDNITIRRDLPLTQPTDYVENDPFPADAHEDALDRSRMIDQQLQEVLDRSLQLPANITGVDVSLPVPEADAPIGWNSTATGLTNNPTNTNLSQIDTAATPDFIGATGGDGVIRTGASISYVDGGDFVTLSVVPGSVDHDALLNFVADEHIAHTSVVLTAGTGLSGGGDITASRTFDVTADYSVITANDGATDVTAAELETLTDGSNADALHAHATITDDRVKIDAAATRDYIGATAADGVIRAGASIAVADGGDFITLTVSEANVDHDSLQNYDANDHVDHTTVDIATAVNTSGLAGGGDISATRNLVVDIANTTAGTVASADEVLIADVDDSDNLKRVTAQSIADLGAGGGPVSIEDEGGLLTAAVSNIDFVGAGVTASNVGSDVTVTIPGGGGGATLTQAVAQATHGFSVNDWVYHNGTIYALADASAAGTAESIGIVSAVADVNNFTVQFGGRITGLSGLTAGEAHFLSETAGQITATAPSTEGAVIKPVLVADSTTTGFIFNMRGVAVTNTTSFFQSFVDGDLSSGVLTVTHSLGHKYCQVQIFNNSDKMIMPDDITLVDNDSLTVDLTSFGTLTGTWRVVVLDTGTTQAYSNTTHIQSFVNGDLSAGVLTISHGLSDQYPIIQVYDENDQVVVPDLIEGVSTNTATVDLSSFGTISGTWRAVLSAIGGTAAATPTSTTFNQSFADGDLTAGVLTVTHNLGTQYNGVTVYDNNGDVIQPDDITATSVNVTTIDLTSYGTLTGTWQAVIIGPGAYSSNIASDLNISGQTTADRLVYDGANWVRKEACAFLVRADDVSQTNIATGSDQQILWVTEVFDIGGNFASNTFTAPVTGLYHLSVGITLANLDSAATYYDIKINAGAVDYTLGFFYPGEVLSADTQAYTKTGSVTVQLTAGQTAIVEFRQQGGTAQTDMTSNSFFSGHLIA